MNMKKLFVILGSVCFGLLMLGQSVFAVPQVGNIDDFNDAAPPAWNQGLNAVITDANIPDLVFSVSGNPAGDGTVSTADGLFTGTYAPVGQYGYIGFVFNSETVAPDQLSLYFETPYNGGQTWYYSGLSTGDGDKMAPIGTWSSGWSTFDPLVVDFATDFYQAILDVDRIGIYVANASPGTYNYHMDDFEIGMAVPEPETVWMILAVALSLGVTFRGRLAELAGQMKGRFVKA